MLGAVSGLRSCNDTPGKMVQQRVEDPASVSDFLFLRQALASITSRQPNASPGRVGS